VQHRSVEARQPHVLDDDDPESVVGVTELLGELKELWL
jgi:hypothetical protein